MSNETESPALESGETLNSGDGATASPLETTTGSSSGAAIENAAAAPSVENAEFELLGFAVDANAVRLFSEGGPVIYLIALLSVAALAIAVWKIWRFAMMGAWGRARARAAALRWADGDEEGAFADVEKGRGPVSVVTAKAMRALLTGEPEAKARERAARVAKEKLAEMRVGLRGLEVIATIAPLLGLLGTVLGMIAAFQTLQESGARADPAALAGGIWEALLTTAAGMAVAIPTAITLNYFESVIERTRVAIEATVSIVFAERRDQPPKGRSAASPRDLRIAE